jgi:leucyl aminopeptidase
MKLEFLSARADSTELLIIPVFDGCAFGENAQKLDAELGGLMRDRISLKREFTGQPGHSLRLTTDPAFGMTDIILIGMGKPQDLNEDGAREAATTLKSALKSVSSNDVTFMMDSVEGIGVSQEAFVAHMVDAYQASIYGFNKYKTNANDNVNPLQLKMVVQDPAAAIKIHDDLKIVTDSAIWARDLGNEPANILTPVNYAKRIENEFRGIPNVKITTLDQADMEELEMGGILAVSQGSTRHPPRIVVLEYDGTNGSDASPIALVGKGVTFDTGGYNLKPGASMLPMNTDMCGSAAVVGAMRALALKGAPAKLVAVVGLAENMVDGNSFRPSDIIKSMSGKTIEIGNTDAEGRLILADCLTYVQRKYDPHTIVDYATLTGAIVAALGNTHTGLFSNDDELSRKMGIAGKQVNEIHWPMPLGPEFTNAVKSNIADLSNTGSMNGAGAITAAAFIEQFIERRPNGEMRRWAHADIAGTSRKGGQATGVGVRTLERHIQNEIADKALANAITVERDISNG